MKPVLRHSLSLIFEVNIGQPESQNKCRICQNRIRRREKLGEMNVMHEGEMDLKSDLVLRDTIDVRVTGDKDGAAPTDVIVLDVNGTDTAVVTDSNNRSVKSFFRRNNQPCHSKLSLDGNPWSVTQLKHNQVAVTVLDTKQIVILEVSPDLKLFATIKTSKQYRGITALTSSTTAASSCDPPSLDILDMTGTVIRSLTPQTRNKDIIQDPEFLCTTVKNNILVSDSGSNSVSCLTPEGDVVFSYSPESTELKCPRGMAVTNTGDILVADWFLHRVLHLSESGQFVRNILARQDGLSYSHALCVDNRRRLYVCMLYGGIKVFSS